MQSPLQVDISWGIYWNSCLWVFNKIGVPKFLQNSQKRTCARVSNTVFRIFKRWINQPVNWKWSPVFQISCENMLPEVRLFMKFMIGIYRNYSFTSISFWEAFWLFDTKIHFLSYQKVESGLGTRLKFEQSFFCLFYNNNLVPKKLNVTNYISVLMLVEWVWH